MSLKSRTREKAGEGKAAPASTAPHRHSLSSAALRPAALAQAPIGFRPEELSPDDGLLNSRPRDKRATTGNTRRLGGKGSQSGHLSAVALALAVQELVDSQHDWLHARSADARASAVVAKDRSDRRAACRASEWLLAHDYNCSQV